MGERRGFVFDDLPRLAPTRSPVEMLRRLSTDVYCASSGCLCGRCLLASMSEYQDVDNAPIKASPDVASVLGMGQQNHNQLAAEVGGARGC